MHGIQSRSVLVVGHADGDGHLAAEQTRRNALAAGANECDVVVDPKITRNYKFWLTNLSCLDYRRYDSIFFVDIMFHSHFVSDSIEALTELARKYPEKNFSCRDHHEIGMDHVLPDNLSIQFSSTVFECCFGEPSELMLIAAICDYEPEPVLEHLQPIHYLRARGVQRAAADYSRLAGVNLMALLRNDCWDIIEEIALEDDHHHKTVRGIRPKSTPPTRGLKRAIHAGKALSLL